MARLGGLYRRSLVDGGLGRSFAEILDLVHESQPPGIFDLRLPRFDRDGEAAVLMLARDVLPGAEVGWLDAERGQQQPRGSCATIRFERIDRTSVLRFVRTEPPTADEAKRVFALAELIALALEAAGPVRFRLHWGW